MNMMNFITWINYEDAFRTLSMLHITVVFATYPYEKEQVTFSLTIKCVSAPYPHEKEQFTFSLTIK